jgi:hypothetical protein
MDTRHPTSTDRRDFLAKAGLGVAAAEALLSDTLSAQGSVARQLTDDEKREAGLHHREREVRLPAHLQQRAPVPR